LLWKLREIASFVWMSGFERKPDDVGGLLALVQEQVPTVNFQVVDLDRVPGSNYLLHAVVNAWKSFKSKQPISHTLSMEMLLYFAANKQINEAIEQVGVGSKTRRSVAVAVGSSEKEVMQAGDLISEMLGAEGNDTLVDECNKDRARSVRQVFGITSKELRAAKRGNEKEWQAVERLVIERSAMLALEK
jgi:tRNA threonylcarbamoyladenosine modification (KEOPS) complex Cgi121 subunit